MLYDVDRKFLSSIGETTTQGIVPVITLFLHGIWCYIFFVRLDMQLGGAALVLIFQNWSNYFCILIIVMTGRGRQFLQWPNRKSFEGWGTIIKEGIPSYFYELVSKLSFDSLVFIAGFISVDLVMVNSSFIGYVSYFIFNISKISSNILNLEF